MSDTPKTDEVWGSMHGSDYQMMLLCVKLESELAEAKRETMQAIGLAAFNKQEAETHYERAEKAEAELSAYKLWAEVEIADLREDGKRLNREIAELQNAFEDSVTALELAERERDKHFAASKAQNEDITSLQAELATCKADADRYRWLRDMNNDEAAVKLFSAWCGQNLDENIDAAIKVSLK